MAELDAAYFHLYGLERDDVEYILFTFKGIHDQQTLFPGHASTAQRIIQKYAEMSFPGQWHSKNFMNSERQGLESANPDVYT